MMRDYADTDARYECSLRLLRDNRPVVGRRLLTRATGSGLALRRPVRLVSNPGVFEHLDGGWDGAALFEIGALA
ncbi:hypothetical protein QQY66_33415 [Streptomyces sp. DG2A-72]|uniref:hypothetical protein n=1 Tax=Streptomyces sp. DG2A-72 TaxID=3051386 RepID=UPI00265C46F8|nr:hypothetical protein [Streptomyces sp. DG2A-72]MDO0936361.1 hypothetical protein [Streptomyces sp. DG2A-72]